MKNVDNAAKYLRKPRILVVDDILENLQVLGTLLYHSGYEVSMLDTGDKALNGVEQIDPDLILLDIMMPGMNGFEVCEKLKENKSTAHIPIIFLTSKSATDDVVKGFDIGGVDYVVKPFEQQVLLARIKNHLDLKFSKEKIEKINKELKKSSEEKDRYLKIINDELESAAEYVTSLLPAPKKNGRIRTRWKFIPSSNLGGDSFGYHWIDKEYFAVYLLDVCYHGIRPALLSVSILNILSNQHLKKVNFRKPDEVLNALNKAFQMSPENDMFFSMWYGVYNVKTRAISFSSAGHPPAVLLDEENNSYPLSSKNVFIGAVKNYEYNAFSAKIPKPSRLYIFSDGVYEIEKKDGTRWNLDKFNEFLIDLAKKYNSPDSSDELEEAYERAIQLRGKEKLKDDYSILKVAFL